MLHYYEIDIVPLYDDRAAAIFLSIIYKISGSWRLTKLRPSDMMSQVRSIFEINS